MDNKINLKHLKIYFICPDNNEKYHKRKLHMEEMLKGMGCTNVHHFKSSTENYPQCLLKAFISILQENLNTPIIILEDDVEWTGESEFITNENYDFVYLGLSRSGGDLTKNRHNGPAEFLLYNESQVRVINMLSAHAVYYPSRKGKEKILEIFKAYSDKPYHIDVLLSRLQAFLVTIANKKPLFYQSAKYNTTNHEESQTKIQITDSLEIIPYG
jgi:GR25 family glycosyltransferase involved in LPS biosynthesis